MKTKVLLFLLFAVTLAPSQTKDNILTWNFTSINDGCVGLMYQHAIYNKSSLGLLVQHSFTHITPFTPYTTFYIGYYYYFRRIFDSFCLSTQTGCFYRSPNDLSVPLELGFSYRWLFFKIVTLSSGISVGPGLHFVDNSYDKLNFVFTGLFDLGVAF